MNKQSIDVKEPKEVKVPADGSAGGTLSISWCSGC